MRDFFNMDNGVFRFLGRVADLMILNIVFIICSIPIITIGASTTALHYVALKMAEDEEGYIVRGFFKSFKQNFKQATLIWLMILGIGIILFLDIQILNASEGTVATVMRIAILAISFVFLMLYLYVFPVLARFYNTIKGTLKNSILMAIANFPYTILMALIVIAAVVVTLLNSYTLWYGLLVWMLLGFALIAFINDQFFKKIFKKYMPEEEEEEDDTFSDSWNSDAPEESFVDSRFFANPAVLQDTTENTDAAPLQETETPEKE